jgi:hypothetical protein
LYSAGLFFFLPPRDADFSPIFFKKFRSYDLGTVCYIGYNYNTPFHADQWTRVLHCAIDM